MSEDILIVALTGMPGAGKTTVANYLSQKGIPLLIMGDVYEKLHRMTDWNPQATILQN